MILFGEKELKAFSKLPGCSHLQKSWRLSQLSGHWAMPHDHKREEHGNILTEFAKIIDAGKLTPMIDEKNFGLKELGKAHNRLTSGRLWVKWLSRFRRKGLRPYGTKFYVTRSFAV